MLILIDGTISAARRELLEARPDCELVEAAPGSSRLKDALAEAAAVIMRSSPLDRAAIDAAIRLKVVSKHGVGFDTIDVDALTQCGSQPPLRGAFARSLRRGGSHRGAECVGRVRPAARPRAGCKP